jgi:hypothetical protein
MGAQHPRPKKFVGLFPGFLYMHRNPDAWQSRRGHRGCNRGSTFNSLGKSKGWIKNSYRIIGKGHPLKQAIFINYISSRTSSNIKHDLPLRSIDGFSTLTSCIVIPCGDRLSHSIRRRPKKSIRNLTVLLKKKKDFLEGLSLSQPNWIILRFDYSCVFYIPVAHPISPKIIHLEV